MLEHDPFVRRRITTVKKTINLCARLSVLHGFCLSFSGLDLPFQCILLPFNHIVEILNLTNLISGGYWYNEKLIRRCLILETSAR